MKEFAGRMSGQMKKLSKELGILINHSVSVFSLHSRSSCLLYHSPFVCRRSTVYSPSSDRLWWDLDEMKYEKKKLRKKKSKCKESLVQKIGR